MHPFLGPKMLLALLFCLFLSHALCVTFNEQALNSPTHVFRLLRCNDEFNLYATRGAGSGNAVYAFENDTAAVFNFTTEMRMWTSVRLARDEPRNRHVLAVTGNSILLVQHSGSGGSGGFAVPQETYTHPAEVRRPLFADVNNDGLTDVLFLSNGTGAASANSTAVYAVLAPLYRNASALLTAAPGGGGGGGGGGGQITRVAVAECSGDTVPDLLVQSSAAGAPLHCAPQTRAAAALGGGGGGDGAYGNASATVVAASLANCALHAAWQAANGDVLVQCDQYSGFDWVLRLRRTGAASGALTFAAPEAVINDVGSTDSRVLFADVNGDALADLVVADARNKVGGFGPLHVAAAVFPQLPDGTFDTAVVLHYDEWDHGEDVLIYIPEGRAVASIVVAFQRIGGGKLIVYESDAAQQAPLCGWNDTSHHEDFLVWPAGAQALRMPAYYSSGGVEGVVTWRHKPYTQDTVQIYFYNMGTRNETLVDEFVMPFVMLHVGDVSNDGIDDILVTSSWGDGTGTGTWKYLGSGDGSFSSSPSVVSGNCVWALVRDFDGDGVNDLLVAGDDRFVRIAGKADGTLDAFGATTTIHPTLSINGQMRGATLLDPPAEPDNAQYYALSAAQQRLILVQDGGYNERSMAIQSTDGFAASFVPTYITDGFSQVEQVAAADVDGDGDVDAVGTDQRQQKVFLFENDGFGRLGVARTLVDAAAALPDGGGAQLFGVCVTDVNGDDVPDVVFSVKRGTGPSAYGELWALPNLGGVGRVAAGRGGGAAFGASRLLTTHKATDSVRLWKSKHNNAVVVVGINALQVIGTNCDVTIAPTPSPTTTVSPPTALPTASPTPADSGGGDSSSGGAGGENSGKGNVEEGGGGGGADSSAAVVAAAVGSGAALMLCSLVAFVFFLLFRSKEVKKRRRRRDEEARELQRRESEVSGVLDAKYIIKPSEVEKGAKIGEGAFGFVFRGKWRGIDVAIKEVRTNSREAEKAKQDLLGEAEQMQRLRPHLNVVTFYGLLLEPFSIVVAFCELGSLDVLLYGKNKRDFTLEQLDTIALGTARGLFHLHREDLIHRDLAARNVLLDAALIPRVADFGMSRTNVSANDEAQMTKTNVGPVRWMAPESMAQQAYSKASDVWMFGVALVEIYTRMTPWPRHNNLEVAQCVMNGECLSLENCEAASPGMVDVVQQCLQHEAGQRPKMEEVVRLMEEAVRYESVDALKAQAQIFEQETTAAMAAYDTPLRGGGSGSLATYDLPSRSGDADQHYMMPPTAAVASSVKSKSGGNDSVKIMTRGSAMDVDGGGGAAASKFVMVDTLGDNYDVPVLLPSSSSGGSGSVTQMSKTPPSVSRSASDVDGGGEAPAMAVALSVPPPSRQRHSGSVSGGAGSTTARRARCRRAARGRSAVAGAAAVAAAARICWRRWRSRSRLRSCGASAPRR